MREPDRPIVDEDNPWPGLDAFDETAAPFFNGRRPEAATLRRLVLHAPLTVLFGASGLGKTSLIQAGLFPLLRGERLLPVYVRLDLRDRTAPLIHQLAHALAAQILEHQVDAPPLREGQTLWHYLHQSTLEFWSAENHLLTPIFVLDQMEEMFTLGADATDAVRNLMVDVADLVENRIPCTLAGRLQNGSATVSGLSLDHQCYRVLFSFREDFLPNVEGWKSELPSLLRNRLRLLPMSEEQAFEAVFLTAPHLVDKALACDIVRFAAAARLSANCALSGSVAEVGSPVEPALLSLLCRGLNEKRKERRKTTIDAELLAGTGRSIIADFYEQAVGGLPGRVQRFVENELITERGYRKTCDADDALQKHGVSDAEIRNLVDKRLIRVEPRRGTQLIELTHDLLTTVVREHREQQRFKERASRRRKRITSAIITAVVILVATVGTLLSIFLDRARRAERAQNAQLQSENARARGLEDAGRIRQQGLRKLREGSYEPALQLFGSSLAIYRRLDDRKNQASTLIAIGDAHRLSHRLSESASSYETALGVGRATADRELEGAALEALASLKEETGELHSALAYYEQAQHAYEDAGDAQSSARLLERRGVVFEDSKESAAAAAVYERALKNYTVTGDRQGRARVSAALRRLGVVSWGYLVDLLHPKLYPLHPETVNIGRNVAGLSNDISFAHSLVSRRHLALNREGKVDDLRSRNGTSLNARVLPYGVGAKLNDRDLLVLANVQALQFFVDRPLRLPQVPAAAWALFVDGQTRTYSYLAAPEYDLAIDSGRLLLQTAPSGKSVFKVRKIDGQYQMFLVGGVWRVYTVLSIRTANPS